MKTIRELGLCKTLVFLAGVLIVASLTMVLFILPASSSETTESKVQKQFSSEFGEVAKVEMVKTEKQRSHYRAQYVLLDEDGNKLAVVDVNPDNMDVLGITYLNRGVTSGDPKIGLDEAREQAGQCAKEYFSAKMTDYSLVQEELQDVWSDVGDQHAYIYKFRWQRSIEGVYLTDSIYIEINAITNEPLLLLGPSGDCLVPSSTDGFGTALTRKDEMIKKAKDKSTSSGELFQKNRGGSLSADMSEYSVKSKDDALLMYGPDPNTGQGKLMWWVTIETEFYDKADLSSPASTYTELFNIDASSGEVKLVDSTL